MPRAQFIPGRRGNVKTLINNFQLCRQNDAQKQSQKQSESEIQIQIDSPLNFNFNSSCVLYEDCQCLQENWQRIKTGYNDPVQTQSKRFTQVITGTLGGKTTFGNFGVPANVTYLGGFEGQPGGSPRPLRNKF
jgi:hypothetical protein